MAAQADGYLLFRFKDLEEEVTALASLADGFIESVSKQALQRYRTELENIRTQPSEAVCRWQISADAPLRTKLSEGAYEANGRRGNLHVRGELSTVWEVKHPLKKGTKRHASGDCLLVGNASTVLRIMQEREDGSEHEIAMWRTEVGDAVSPGCHFHVQVLGRKEDPLFPHALSIPRLPALAITPMDAFEFLLGELFQDEWKAESAKESFQLSRWRSIQRKRLVKLFDWQREIVAEGTQSPWASLKGSKPPGSLFG